MTSDLDAVIADLKAKHGTIFAVELDEDMVIFRRPTTLEWRQYKAAKQDDAKKVIAEETLTAAVVVYPDGPALSALLAKLPALSTNIANKVYEVSGGAAGEVKKL